MGDKIVKSAQAKAVIEKARKAGWTIATIESCTGGLIFAALTDIAGSSVVMDRGFITYSNQAKQDMAAVMPDTLGKYGAVSEQTAKEMAQGGLSASKCQIALSVTGIAGPGGGSAEKPVGLVWMSVATCQGKLSTKAFHFDGTRAQIRQQAVLEGLTLLLDYLPD